MNQPYTTLVSTDDLAKNLSNPHWVVFDCRCDLTDHEAGKKAYHEGHIPQARFCDLLDDLSSPITNDSGRHPPPFEDILLEKLGNWGVDNKTQVVVYDDAGGGFAVRLWWQLREFGHDSVAVLDGGINQWVAEGRKLSTEIPVITPTTFAAQPACNTLVTTDEVVANLQEPDFTLVDARTAERYRGDAEPIDTVAGRIPGALNHPFQDNLDENGLFKSAEELRESLKQSLGDIPADQVVHMCGSGVTAVHNMLAMEIAGMPGSKLYLGSWSEWIRDNDRPVATG